MAIARVSSANRSRRSRTNHLVFYDKQGVAGTRIRRRTEERQSEWAESMRACNSQEAQAPHPAQFQHTHHGAACIPDKTCTPDLRTHAARQLQAKTNAFNSSHATRRRRTTKDYDDNDSRRQANHEYNRAIQTQTQHEATSGCRRSKDPKHQSTII